ncbi:hypothetical protein JK358_14475 [Nocardia sp. 2]|uniref:DUF8020 domain-containing protein n=1 Tax=Nocardia acididurans TaxID=2802282 RepID=A0ABS1M4L7_9NOCA|nr:hypothetical protein [Nocardia acididurans]MBL1075602.1 hypothetical protein [Nocardia acididurans]
MGTTKSVAPVLLCLAAATTLAATPAAAAPATTDSAPQSSLRLRGTDHGVAFQTAVTDDHRATVSTLQAGRFLATFDGQAVLVTDEAGLEIATVPLRYDVAGKTLAVTPEIADNGRRLTLTPIGESDTPVRDINAQRRFFDAAAATVPGILGGAAIGAAIGFLIGFPAGLFIYDFISVPITTVLGAIIGGVIGFNQSGGQAAIDAGLAYADSLANPGTSPK